MRILVGSNNPVKINAVQRAFSKFWDVEISNMEVDSGVSDMPMSDEESIKGALNRAMNAMQPNIDFSVGLEGGLIAQLPVQGGVPRVMDHLVIVDCSSGEDDGFTGDRC